jgi:acyl-homoserine lactone acylase PvdQ
MHVTRIKAHAPDDLWQMDFKGQVALGPGAAIR